MDYSPPIGYLDIGIISGRGDEYLSGSDLVSSAFDAYSYAAIVCAWMAMAVAVSLAVPGMSVTSAAIGVFGNSFNQERFS